MTEVGTLFKHYKGKLYRFIGIVRHSETLEELVVYEALYENALGRTWVRPKSMFFEEVAIGDKRVPRFQQVNEG